METHCAKVKHKEVCNLVWAQSERKTQQLWMDRGAEISMAVIFFQGQIHFLMAGDSSDFLWEYGKHEGFKLHRAFGGLK